MRPLIFAENINKSYFGDRIFDNARFELFAGEIAGLFGQNGSGKTTLFKILSLLTDYEGSIVFDSHSLCRGDSPDIAFFESVSLFPRYMTVRDATRYVADFFPFDIQYARALQSSLKLFDKSRIVTMSSGEAAKLRLSLTLARKAKLYLIDEPYINLDNSGKDVLTSTLISLAGCVDKTVIISTHEAYEVEKLLDRVLLIQGGRIHGYEADELRQKSGMSIEQYCRENRI